MDPIIELLNAQPFITLFLVIGIGYLVGRISVAGFSLGVGAILFVGLAVGAVAPEAAPPPLVGLISLVLFLYGIGIQYGRDFFKGLASMQGLKANLLGVLAVVAACAVAIATAQWLGFGMDFAAGIFAGSLSSTATLQVALDTAGNNNPATGYALTYPFGIFGPILCFYLAKLLFKPKVDRPVPKRLVLAEAHVSERGLAEKTVADLLLQLPEGVELLMIRRNDRNLLPEPTLTLQADDLFEVVGFPEQIAELGLKQSHVASDDRRQFDYVRVFVSNLSLIGTKVSALPQPAGYQARVVQIRRGDVDLLPGPDDTLEYGDQVGILVESDAKDKVSEVFGDSIPQAQSSFDFISHCAGLALGGLMGLLPIPIPGVGNVTLGIAGGTLVMSLVYGYLRRIGPFDWQMPVAANLVLRKFGISVFLAGVGLASGHSFVENLGASGVFYVLAGMLVLLTDVMIVLIGGYFLLRLKFDQVLGTGAGTTGNPAILAYANQLAPTGQPNILYAMIFPGAGTIVKLIAVQVMLAMASTAVPAG